MLKVLGVYLRYIQLNIWSITLDGNPGNPNKIEDSSGCHLSIRSLVESNIQFKDCLCTDDLHGTVNKLLGKKCISESGNTLLYGIFKDMKKKNTI